MTDVGLLFYPSVPDPQLKLNVVSLACSRIPVCNISPTSVGLPEKSGSAREVRRSAAEGRASTSAAKKRQDGLGKCREMWELCRSAWEVKAVTMCRRQGTQGKGLLLNMML